MVNDSHSPQPTVPPPVPVVPPTSDLRVGGRLQGYWEKWQQAGASPWVVEVLKEGFRVQFHREPPLRRTPWFGLNSKHPEVNAHIQKMLDKGALEEVRDPSTPGYYSRIFLTPKRTGDLRPVIDLKQLNKYILLHRFKMETPLSIMRALQVGMWAFSIDLKDAYFHVPIHPSSRKYLRICMGDRVFQFRALPFGISSAPWIFTKIFKEIAVILRRKGIQHHQYLDDWLNLAWSKLQLEQERRVTLQLCVQLGCLINQEKSELTPTQDFVFIGVHFDLLSGRVKPAPDKAERLATRLAVFQREQSLPARAWQGLVGLLTHLSPYVPWGNIRLRPIQLHLLRHHRPQVQPQDLLIPITDEVKSAILWWTQAHNLYAGVPLHQRDHHVTIFTDASEEGWGAHHEQTRISGVWSEEDRTFHINVLELRAISRALAEFKFPHGSHILVNTDNTTVVAYVNKQGGTRSIYLMEETYALFDLLVKGGWTLRARHLPGVKNVIADALSRRNQVIPSEWSLLPSVVKRIFHVWGSPNVDLFATHLNTKLPVYVSPLPDEVAWKVDALSISWEGLDAYAYPPAPLIGKVLEKIQAHHCRVILIASAWPAQPWFPQLLDLLTDHPFRLPPTDSLLKQTGKPIFHTNPEHLNLHAWRLLGRCSGSKGSQRKSFHACWNPSESPPADYTKADGWYSALGVNRGITILSRPLPQ